MRSASLLSASAVDERGGRKIGTDHATVSGKRAFTLLERLGGDATGLFGFFQRLDRVAIDADDVGDEIGGLLVAVDDLLERREIGQPFPAGLQLLAYAFELVLDLDQCGQHAIAIVNGRVKVGNRPGLAHAALFEGQGLQPVQQHQLGVEAGAVLIDEGNQLLAGHGVQTAAGICVEICVHASRTGVSSFRASSIAVTSCLSATSSNRDVM